MNLMFWDISVFFSSVPKVQNLAVLQPAITTRYFDSRTVHYVVLSALWECLSFVALVLFSCGRHGQNVGLLR